MRRKQLFAQKPHFYQTFPIIFMIYSDTFGCIGIFSVTMPGHANRFAGGDAQNQL